ncbi:unnamed protein product [Owenia fusiformis]|uniref:Uncharacterized protein n=1 Tax=Owenia fusiformis TaxID=6347 RepID=A0A8S4NXU5_OWEFU|nr:unnamed protein product [Owenia fusiformis]
MKEAIKSKPKVISDWKKLHFKMPLIMSSLNGAMPKVPKMMKHVRLGKKEKIRTLTIKEKQRYIDARVSTILSMLVFSNNHRVSAMQKALGAQLWRHGCDSQTT